MEVSIRRVLCKTCANRTRHEVLFSKRISWEDEESIERGVDDYMVVQCMGCESISFVVEHTSSEFIDEEFGPYAVLDVFPDRCEGINSKKNLFGVPPLIMSIYRETLEAAEHNQPILAGIGIRAIIEAVCENQNSTGNNLYEKIENLKENKVLSEASTEILHKLRTLGNDAAHKIVVPEMNQLQLAIDVVQNLLQEVYVFPRNAARKFPTQI